MKKIIVLLLGIVSSFGAETLNGTGTTNIVTFWGTNLFTNLMSSVTFTSEPRTNIEIYFDDWYKPTAHLQIGTNIIATYTTNRIIRIITDTETNTIVLKTLGVSK